jgi:hypothetical protein
LLPRREFERPRPPARIAGSRGRQRTAVGGPRRLGAVETVTTALFRRSWGIIARNVEPHLCQPRGGQLTHLGRLTAPARRLPGHAELGDSPSEPWCPLGTAAKSAAALENELRSGHRLCHAGRQLMPILSRFSDVRSACFHDGCVFVSKRSAAALSSAANTLAVYATGTPRVMCRFTDGARCCPDRLQHRGSDWR